MQILKYGIRPIRKSFYERALSTPRREIDRPATVRLRFQNGMFRLINIIYTYPLWP